MKTRSIIEIRSLFNPPNFYVHSRKFAHFLFNDFSSLKTHCDSKANKHYKHTVDRKTFKSF